MEVVHRYTFIVFSQRFRILFKTQPVECGMDGLMGQLVPEDAHFMYPVRLRMPEDFPEPGRRHDILLIAGRLDIGKFIKVFP